MKTRVRQHLAVLLWEQHHPRAGYPPGVIAVPEPIIGTAFFPGGYGIWNPGARWPLPAFPVGGIMVLGHDFHSEAGYRESCNRGFERMTQPTWRSLRCLLDEAGIPLKTCFFTNAYMGLRKGRATTGVFPGAKDTVFVQHCRTFLREQISTQRPSLIVTLGVYVPQLLSPLSPQLAVWSAKRGLKYLDIAGPVQTNVRIRGVKEYKVTVVALTHPSFRSAGVKWRRYGGFTGHAAELAMLRKAMLSRQKGGYCRKCRKSPIYWRQAPVQFSRTAKHKKSTVGKL